MAAIAETTPSDPPQTTTASIEVTINVTSSGRWSKVAKLSAPRGATRDSFGSSVAADEATGNIVVGAKGAGSNAGAVYVFDGMEDDSPVKLTAPTAIVGQEVGYSVAIDGDTIVVGTSPASATAAGNVYVFVKPATGG